MANLLMTLMDKIGVPVERLGGSTGKVADPYACRVMGEWASCHGWSHPRMLTVASLLRLRRTQEAPIGDGSTALHWAAIATMARPISYPRGANVNAAKSRRDAAVGRQPNGSAPDGRTVARAGANPNAALLRRNPGDGRRPIRPSGSMKR